ncbi:MAG: RNA-binding protein [Alphaproteobacteria bacterium]|nr:RNA-binding protein [Alphaproteobacteria bacterium]
MTNKIHIGNLAYSVNDETLKETFEQFGAVHSAVIVKDKGSGRSKGFGFIEMVSEEDAANAIEKLNKTELEGRMMFVSEAKSTGPFPEGTSRRRSNGGGKRHFGNRRPHRPMKSED